MSYNRWISEIDSALVELFSLHISDLPDWNWRAQYDAGTPPLIALRLYAGSGMHGLGATFTQRVEKFIQAREGTDVSTFREALETLELVHHTGDEQVDIWMGYARRYVEKAFERVTELEGVR